MPRKRRITIPGVLHHIMARGIEGRNIFNTDGDRQIFLDLLQKGIAATGYRCYAWVLLPNHYHLLLRTSEKPLSELMRKLNSNYAIYYNKKYNRRGYLFQDRYKSIATQDQGYIEELIRYIHLNPVRSGICKTVKPLDSYKWCGHSMLMGHRNFSFQHVDEILLRFGKTRISAQQHYRKFIEKGLKEEETDSYLQKIRMSNTDKENIHDYGCWVIGDKEFVKQALSSQKARELRISKYIKAGWNLDRLMSFVSEEMRIDREELLKRGRGCLRSESRKIFAYLGYRVLGFTVASISRYLNISGPAVSQSLKEGEKIAKKRRMKLVI